MNVGLLQVDKRDIQQEEYDCKEWQHVCGACGRGFDQKHGLAVHEGHQTTAHQHALGEQAQTHAVLLLLSLIIIVIIVLVMIRKGLTLCSKKFR